VREGGDVPKNIVERPPKIKNNTGLGVTNSTGIRFKNVVFETFYG
jgi:hypothetical protein